MAEFLILMTWGPGPAPAPPPPEEMQAVIARYVAWGERMQAGGHASPRGGARLSDVFSDPGRALSGSGADFVATDGPLAETKEVVGGYSVIEARDYDEAVELCRDHPALDPGRIQLRQLA
jgi:hypothetical protein